MDAIKNEKKTQALYNSTATTTTVKKKKNTTCINVFSHQQCE